MTKELLSQKEFYSDPLKDGDISSDLKKDCYAVFACRHKFCVEVCPIYKEIRNESYTSYGFHTAVLAVSQDLEKLSALANSFSYCLLCGACQLRCPSTLFAGDYYKRTTTTVDLVRKVRLDLNRQGILMDGWENVQNYIDEHENYYNGPSDALTEWCRGIEAPRKGENILFVDYFNASQTTEVPRLALKILQAAGVKVGILEKPAVTTGELLESDPDKWVKYAKENVELLKKAGAKKVIFINPHEYMYFIRDYPKYTGDSLPFEPVFITDLLVELVDEGKLKFSNPVNMKITYQDPCTLNKFCGLTESPRRLLKSIPGLEFKDIDPVTQWQYCCGNGTTSFRRLHPDLAYKIGLERMRSTADVAETLVLGCPHCKDQYAEVQAKSKLPVEPKHILEIIGLSMGIEI